MRSRSLADFGDRLLGLLPTAATASAEGAWIAVVYAALQLGVARGQLVLSPWAFATAAWVGIVAGRRIRGRAAPTMTVGFAVAAGLAGWLADPTARAMVATTAWTGSFAQHGAGWLVGFAVWRGTRHGDPAIDDLVVSSLLAWAVPLLAVPWLVGTATASRQRFVDAALPATLLFVAAGLVAIGLARLDTLERAVGVDWRRNRTWLALLVGVVGLVVAIGTPIAFLLGASLEAIGRTVLGPLGAVVTGLGAVVVPIGEGIGRVVGLLVGPAGPAPSATLPPRGPAIPPIPDWVGTAVAAVLGLAMLALALVLRRLTGGGPRTVRWKTLKTEERRIVLPVFALRLPTVRVPRFRLVRAPRPRTASDAYFAALRDLDRDGRLARTPAESPAAHARRLRVAGVGALSFDLLAADFELERYAAVTLTAAETRRAIRRSRIGRPSRVRGQTQPEA